MGLKFLFIEKLVIFFSQGNVLLVSLFPNKVTSFDSVDLPESEDPKNVVRVGWSTDSASLQLGTFTIIV